MGQEISQGNRIPEAVTTIQNTPPASPQEQTARASWPPAVGGKRIRQPILLKIALLSLAGLLIVSGMGFIIYTLTRQYTAEVNAAALADTHATQSVVAQAQGTTNALNTAQANINATATAQAAASVTATVNATDATATAGAYQQQYIAATTGAPAFDDPLSDENGPGLWDHTTTPTASGCSFTNGQYTVDEAQRGYMQPCIAKGTQFSDFAYQVNVTLAQGNQDQAGMLFRVDATNQAYYFFHIGADGSYAIDVYNDNNKASTLAQGISTAILTGLNQSNELAVLAKGSVFILLVNSQYVTTVTDHTLQAGKIGVAVVNNGTPVSAQFSNAQIWNG
jgi:hypothetical protein